MQNQPIIPPPTREELEREFDFVDELVTYWHERYERSREAYHKSERQACVIHKTYWRNGWWVNGGKPYYDNAKRWRKAHEVAMNEAEERLDYYTDWMIQCQAWLANYNLLVKSWPLLLAQLGM